MDVRWGWLAVLQDDVRENVTVENNLDTDVEVFNKKVTDGFLQAAFEAIPQAGSHTAKWQGLFPYWNDKIQVVIYARNRARITDGDSLGRRTMASSRPIEPGVCSSAVDSQYAKQCWRDCCAVLTEQYSLELEHGQESATTALFCFCFQPFHFWAYAFWPNWVAFALFEASGTTTVYKDIHFQTAYCQMTTHWHYERRTS